MKVPCQVIFWLAIGLQLVWAAAASSQAANAPGWDEGRSLVRDHWNVWKDRTAKVCLAEGGQVADIFVDRDAVPLVGIAARLLADDIERVTGLRPEVKNDPKQLGRTAILIGTLGKSAVVDGLVKEGKLDPTALRGRWEAFGIQTVVGPLPGVKRALVILGNDRRGTAYGVMELCRGMGVSPWYWWADVPVARREKLYAGSSTLFTGAPSVKYRGIFINDEKWGFSPWATKTLDPKLNDVGPKTYEKVFELMLRLRLNYLWPSMWREDGFLKKEFGATSGNVELADQWGIVIGASHCEPMLRNNQFMPASAGPWRYDTNRERILAYWEDWAIKRGPYEAVWTVGMRGIHDSPMEGGNTVAEQMALVEKAITDQRTLLDTYARPHWNPVPQCFIPYKEGLPLYDAGLKVPDDVTIVWPDDNWGYIRRLPGLSERKRPGGNGVYYHVDYVGAPEKYVWFNSTPPAKIWVEMRKAWDNDARTMWVLNVGDVKSQELSMDFWARLAWNVDAFGPAAQPAYLEALAAEFFGFENAKPVGGIWNEFFRLCFIRRPETTYSLDWTQSLGPSMRASLMKDYEALTGRAGALRQSISDQAQDAYFETVLYPVKMLCASGLMALQLDRQLRATNDSVVAEQSRPAGEQWCEVITRETKYYNETLAGGKWRHMMAISLNNGHPRADRSFIENRNMSVLPTKVPDQSGVFKTFDAADFTRKFEVDNARWEVISGLGWNGRAMALFPMTESNAWELAQSMNSAPHLEYEFAWKKVHTNFSILVHVLPSFRLSHGMQLRVAASLDGAPVKTGFVDGSNSGRENADESAPERRDIIRNNRATVRFSFAVARTGRHVLRLWTPDPGVVLDAITVRPRDVSLINHDKSKRIAEGVESGK